MSVAAIPISSSVSRSSLIAADKPSNNFTKTLSLKMHKLDDDQQLVCRHELYKFICHGYR